MAKHAKETTIAVERYPISAKELASPLTLSSTKSQHIFHSLQCRFVYLIWAGHAKETIKMITNMVVMHDDGNYKLVFCVLPEYYPVGNTHPSSIVQAPTYQPQPLLLPYKHMISEVIVN